MKSDSHLVGGLPSCLSGKLVPAEVVPSLVSSGNFNTKSFILLFQLHVHKLPTSADPVQMKQPLMMTTSESFLVVHKQCSLPHVIASVIPENRIWP